MLVWGDNNVIGWTHRFRSWSWKKLGTSKVSLRGKGELPLSHSEQGHSAHVMLRGHLDDARM